MKPRVLTLLFALSVVLLTGCSSAPPTSRGLYGNEPVPTKVRGSNAQALLTRVLDFSKDEVFEAASKAMLRLGYNAEDKNPSLGRITANGFFQCGGGLMPPITMAVYLKQISAQPETQVTVLLDRHDFQCWGVGETRAADELLTEIQKVLSTF